MPPFVARKLGPRWFQREFPLKETRNLKNNVEVWKAYLTLTFLSVKITIGKTDYKLIGYYPHLVARQFGLSQLRPEPIAIFCETIYENLTKCQRPNTINNLVFSMV